VRVVITGAAGRIGWHVVDELSDSHELRLVDRKPVPGRDTTVGDLSVGGLRRRRWLRWRSPTQGWERAFEGAEIVVHLAGNPSPQAAWASVLRHNIGATWNVLEAAARHGARRVILASTCRWTLGLDPEARTNWDELHVDAATPPRPRTPYGLSKVCAEAAGRLFVDTGRLPSGVAVRIGAFSAAPSPDSETRRLWLRPSDLRTLVRRCVEAEFSGFHIVYGISREAAAPFDLSRELSLLGWEPAEPTAEPTEAVGV
jgi:NAD+ dependent glucose-6-phosphate dehydrogenase